MKKYLLKCSLVLLSLYWFVFAKEFDETEIVKKKKKIETRMNRLLRIADLVFFFTTNT